MGRIGIQIERKEKGDRNKVGITMILRRKKMKKGQKRQGKVHTWNLIKKMFDKDQPKPELEKVIFPHEKIWKTILRSMN